MSRRFLNVWDSLARLCIPARYRFDEDSGSDENTERGRLLLRQEQASACMLCCPHLLSLVCSSFKATVSAYVPSGLQQRPGSAVLLHHQHYSSGRHTTLALSIRCPP